MYIKRMITIVLLCINTTINAQDLIVTANNDTINAKITKIKKSKEVIYFHFMKGDKLTSTLLPIAEVRTYKKDYFTTSDIPENARLGSSYQGERVRLAFNGGYGFRIAKISENTAPVLKEHIKQLKSAFDINIDGSYFISEAFGIGIKYSRYKASQLSENILFTFEDNSTEIGLKSTNEIHYVGPSLITRLFSGNEKGAFISLISMGYVNYEARESIGSRNTIKTVGNSMGLALDMGYDFRLSEGLWLGLSGVLTTSSINKVKVTEGNSTQTVYLKEQYDEVESLSRAGIFAGIRFHL